MTAGADQRLIASELEAPVAPPEQPVEQYTPPADGEDGEAPKRDPGTLEISHTGDSDTFEAPEESEPEPKQPQVQVSEDGQLLFEPEGPLPQISSVRGVPTDGLPTESAGKTEVKRERLVEPPRMGGADLTANLTPEDLDPSTEELTLPPINSPLLSHNETVLQPSSELPAPPKPENSFIPQQPLQPAPPAWQPPEPPATPPKPEPKFEPVAPAPVTPPLPTPAPAPLPEPPALVAPPAPAPLPPAPGRPMPPAPPAPAPGATLSDIEKSVSSPHVHSGDDGTFSNNLTPPPAAVDDARSAVQAALNSPAAPIGPLPPVTSLNAQPLGPDLHAAPVAPAAPAVPNLGFSEPTPGNTPADSTLDMPLPSNPFGPGQQATPPAPAAPSAFPGTPPPTTGGAALPPPPVPPPFTPPQV
jgi:hypothetical protein